MKLCLFSDMRLLSKLVLGNFLVPKKQILKLQFDILVEREIFLKIFEKISNFETHVTVNGQEGIGTFCTWQNWIVCFGNFAEGRRIDIIRARHEIFVACKLLWLPARLHI